MSSTIMSASSGPSSNCGPSAGRPRKRTSNQQCSAHRRWETTPAMVISGEAGRTARRASASDSPSHFQRTSAPQIEPADQLSPLVGHERRAIPGQCHERGNTLPAPSGDRFFDWGDASVAHPFTSLLIALRAMADTFGLPPGDPVLRRFRDAYLEPWGLGRGAAGAQPARLGRGNCGSRRRRGADDEVSDRCPAARRAGARRCCRRRRSRPSAPSLPAGPPPRRQGRPRPRPLPCA